MSSVLLAFTGDIHSPRYLSTFATALNNLTNGDRVEAIVFVGDIVEKNYVEGVRPVIELTRKKLQNAKIVMVFGNEEYRGHEKPYVEKFNEVIWLNDSETVLELSKATVGIIGTRGALDKLTTWQMKNAPWLNKYYRELPNRIKDLARSLRSKCNYVILASHYGVTRRTLIGEDTRSWPYLASSLMEALISKDLFDLIVHAHVHRGEVERALINGVYVYNVSLQARGRIITIDLEKPHRDLMSYALKGTARRDLRSEP